MPIHMNDCSYVHSCVASVELSMVRTYNIYISTYRTSLSVYNIFHRMSTLTASHAASMIDTTVYTHDATTINATITFVWCIVCIYRGIVCRHMPYNSFCGSLLCVYTTPRMFIYPTDFTHCITQINQFSYISTDFLHLYIHMF